MGQKQIGPPPAGGQAHRGQDRGGLQGPGRPVGGPPALDIYVHSCF